MVKSIKTATFLQARALQEARGLDDRSDANCQCTHMCPLVQQSCQCRGQPAGSFLLLLVGPHTDRMQLDRGVVPAQVQKRPILKKTVELQQQFLDVHDLLEGSIAAQVLATRQPQDTHREVCVLTRSVRIYFVGVHCDDVVPIWQSTSPYFRQNHTSKTHPVTSYPLESSVHIDLLGRVAIATTCLLSVRCARKVRKDAPAPSNSST